MAVSAQKIMLPSFMQLRNAAVSLLLHNRRSGLWSVESWSCVRGVGSLHAGLHYTYPRDKRRAHFLAQMEPLNPEVSSHTHLELSLYLHHKFVHALPRV